MASKASGIRGFGSVLESKLLLKSRGYTKGVQGLGSGSKRLQLWLQSDVQGQELSLGVYLGLLTGGTVTTSPLHRQHCL